MSMEQLELLAEVLHRSFEARTKARDQALAVARQLTRCAAHAIRAIHRGEQPQAEEFLDEAHKLTIKLKSDLAEYPDLYFAGYTQDAIKEFAEARITCALVLNQALPMPEELGIEYAVYLNGMAEAASELRRRCLDELRQGYSSETERLLTCMDDIYSMLVTMDYPDGITNGLRRQTDVLRSVLERTRGDLTLSLRQHHLERLLADCTRQMESQDHDAHNPRL